LGFNGQSMINSATRAVGCRPNIACGDSDSTVDKVRGQAGLFTVPVHPFGQHCVGRDGDRMVRDLIVSALALSMLTAVADTWPNRILTSSSGQPQQTPPRHFPHNSSVLLPRWAVKSAQQLSELGCGQPRLTQNGSQRAAGERSVQRHDNYPPVGMPQLRVTALRRGVREPNRFKCSNDFPTRDLRQGRTHAGMRISIGVTSGWTTSAVMSPSSKYNSRASRRFASASSIVSPWLATSISRQRATNQLPSLLTAAVSVRVRSTFLGYWAIRHLRRVRARVADPIDLRACQRTVRSSGHRCDSTSKVRAAAARPAGTEQDRAGRRAA
jgi:hypothetical protein